MSYRYTQTQPGAPGTVRWILAYGQAPRLPQAGNPDALNVESLEFLREELSRPARRDDAYPVSDCDYEAIEHALRFARAGKRVYAVREESGVFLAVED